MRTLGRHIIIIAISKAAAEVIKSVIRAKPETHMKYVDFLYEQARMETMRFERLHAPKEGAGGERRDAGADRR